MPPFITVPPNITPRRGLQEGLPGYSAGSFAIGQSPALFWVQNVTASGATVTLGVRQYAGNIPAVGQLITVVGTVVGGALVNVTRVALTAVSITPATGIGTLQYASAAPALAQTNDGGQAVVDVPEVGDALAVQKYMQFALPQPAGPALETGRVITWTWLTPSAPATISLQLEGAIDDQDAQYSIIGAAQTTLSGSVIGNVPIAIRFCRINVTAVTGGVNPTLVAKILI